MQVKALFLGFLYGSKLAFQSLGLIAQTAVKRRSAKSAFKKTMILEGIPPKIANEISEEYPNPIAEIFSLIKNKTFS